MAKKSSTTVQEQRYYRWAMLVFRLMTEPRGVPLDDLQREFGIADRTWRKDRSEFRGAFEPFLDKSTGEPLVVLDLASPPARGLLVLCRRPARQVTARLESRGPGGQSF